MHPHVNFLRASLANQVHYRTTGRATHDRVVDKDHSFALDGFGQDVEFEGDTGGSKTLIGLDESAADVAVLDEGFLVGNAGVASVADGGRSGGVRQPNDHIGVDGGLLRELGSHSLAHHVQPVTLDFAVGSGEVNQLEEAQRVVLGNAGAMTEQPISTDLDNLAWLDFTLECRADGHQCRRLRRNHPVGPNPAKAQRPNSQRVAHGKELGIGHHCEAERSYHPGHGVPDFLGDGDAGRTGDHPGEDLGIGCSLEELPLLLQFQAEGERVGEVAIVRDGQFTEVTLDTHRASVADAVRAGSGVARVADGEVAGEILQVLLIERLRDEPEAGVAGNVMAIGRRDTGALLSPMLQRVEREERDARHILTGSIDAEHPTFFMRFVHFVEAFVWRQGIDVFHEGRGLPA